VMVTAVENPDGSIAVVLFNPGEIRKNVELEIGGKTAVFSIDGKAIQTITTTSGT